MSAPFSVRTLAAVALAAAIAMPRAARATTYTWTTGTFVPGTTGPNPLTSPDILQINHGGSKAFDGIAFDNQSLVLWNADELLLQNGSITNEGRWEMTSDNFFNCTSSVVSTFTNTGEFVKSAANGGLITSGIGRINFVNFGTVEADVGTITFSGGRATFNSGSLFRGAGSTLITSNTSFNGAITSDNHSLVLQTGTFTGNSVLLNGITDFTGGAMTGSWEIPFGQILYLKDGAGKGINGGTLTNKGTFQWQSTGTFTIQNASTINNQGLFNMLTGGFLSGPSGPASSFINSGTLSVAAGQTVTLTTPLVNNAGILQADGQLTILSSSITFSPGTVFAGAGINSVASSATFNADFSSANLSLNGGTYTGNAAISSGVVQWAGGKLIGDWDTGTATWNIVGGDKILDGARFTNNSIINENAGRLLFFNGATLTNRGLFASQENTEISQFTGARSTFDNRGTISVAPGKRVTISGMNFVNNGGTIDVGAGGTLSFSSGSVTFNDGTRFTGDGEAQVGGTFNGNFYSSNALIRGGTGNNAVLNGKANWDAGFLLGSWTIAPGATLEGKSGFTGQGDKLIGSTFTNQGTLLWNSITNLMVSEGGKIFNQGTIDFHLDGSIVYTIFSDGTFINTGLITKSGGLGTASIGGNVNLQNLGIIEVNSGILALPSNFTNRGILRGTGQFRVDNLTNAGHLAPGNSPGTLNLTANYVQAASGSFDVELQSVLSHDLLLINGDSTLGGTLSISCFAACNFAAGDQIVILDATGALSGTFANVTQSGFATGAFDVVYDTAQSRVLLRVTQAATPAPEPGNIGVILVASLVGALRRCKRAR